MADTGNEDDADVLAMFDLTQKKKKKKVKKADDGGAAGAEGGGADGEAGDAANGGAAASAGGGGGAASSSSSSGGGGGVSDVDPPSYTYSQLLNRVVDFLHANNPDLIEKRRYTMKPPQLMRVGTKKTLWVNFQEICKTMRRNPEHLFQFMMAELGTEGSIDGNQRLVIRGKFVPKYIESLLRKYIGEYVTCQMCRSFNTALSRDSVSRLFFVQCQDCGSTRSVAQIRAGYHAETRADRRAARAEA
jgi:translation initiation factor 2 subunit 2